MQHDGDARVRRHPSLGRAISLSIPGAEGEPEESVKGAATFDVRNDEVDLNDSDHGSQSVMGRGFGDVTRS